MNVPDEGPYLISAVICEKVLAEKDGVTSLIRIVDRFSGPEPTNVPEGQNAALRVKAFLYVLFKAGPRGSGSHTLSIALRGENGLVGGHKEYPAELEEGEDRGAAHVLELDLSLPPAQYWFEIALDGVCYTKVPLRVTWHPQNAS